MSTRKIRVLVADDSAFMRTVLKDTLSKSPNIEVVGTAKNGEEALASALSLMPDAVTLDIEMPGISGIEVLRRLMREKPMPVIIVSATTQAGAKNTVEALQLGAIECVPKPAAGEAAALTAFRERVIAAVEAAGTSSRAALQTPASVERTISRAESFGDVPLDVLVAIGISAGGPMTLHRMMPRIPKRFPPIVITQHMPPGFTSAFAQRLNKESDGEVLEAQGGEELRPGMILIAPGSHHLGVVSRRHKLVAELNDGPRVSGFRPSVDYMFESVVKSVGGRAVGVVMTGMGSDGSAGIKKLKACGARTLAQDQASSVVYGMPKAAAATGCIDKVVSLDELPAAIAAALRELKPQPAGVA